MASPSIAEFAEDPRLVEGDPLLDSIAKTFVEKIGIDFKVVNNFWVWPAAEVLNKIKFYH